MVTQAAHAPDPSDFTRDEGAMFLRLPAGRSCVSGHRRSEFPPGADADADADPEPALLSVDSRRTSSVFHPDMSASTLNGCRRQAFGSAVLSVVSARVLSSSDELQPREVMTPPGLAGTLAGTGCGR